MEMTENRLLALNLTLDLPHPQHGEERGRDKGLGSALLNTRGTLTPLRSVGNGGPQNVSSARLYGWP